MPFYSGIHLLSCVFVCVCVLLVSLSPQLIIGIDTSCAAPSRDKLTLCHVHPPELFAQNMLANTHKSAISVIAGSFGMCDLMTLTK